MQLVDAPAGSIQVQYIDPEFSAVCPKTGLPDFGKVIIQYRPDKYLAELKALKLYLRCYYGVGIMHEAVTHKICKDFANVIDPVMVRVVGDWGARGGIKTVTSTVWSQVDGFYDELDGWCNPSFENAIIHWSNE